MYQFLITKALLKVLSQSWISEAPAPRTMGPCSPPWVFDMFEGKSIYPSVLCHNSFVIKSRHWITRSWISWEIIFPDGLVVLHFVEGRQW